MAGGMHGGGGMCGRGGHAWLMSGGGGHAWLMSGGGGMHGRGHAWQGGAWQERRPLQRAVCILLQCILVLRVNKASCFRKNNIFDIISWCIYVGLAVIKLVPILHFAALEAFTPAIY